MDCKLAQQESVLAEPGRAPVSDERTGERAGRASASSPGGEVELTQEVGRSYEIGPAWIRPLPTPLITERASEEGDRDERG